MINIFLNKDSNGNYTEPSTLYTAIKSGTFMDISIINFSDVDNTGEVSYRLNPSGSFVMGKNNLLQRVIKGILTIQGSSSYDPKFGSKFYGIYTAISLDEIEDLKTKFPLFLKTLADTLVEEDLIAIANGNTILPEERLKNLIVENIEYDDTFSGWLITLRIITAANTSLIITLP